MNRESDNDKIGKEDLNNIQPLRGFREFYPEIMIQKRAIFNVLAETAKLFGFEEIDVPSVEPLQLFKLKSGDEIVKNTFSFKDKGGRDVTLIAEMTPTIARMVSNKIGSVPLPIRWFSNPKIWRYEEPQKGRMREFYQFNIDLIGVKNRYVDAEILYLAYMMMERAGVEKFVEIRLSHRKIVSYLFDGLDKSVIENLYKLIDKRDKLDNVTFEKEARNIIKNEEYADLLKRIIDLKMPLKEGIERLEKMVKGNEKLNEIIEELKDLCVVLEWYGIERKIILDISIVRGLSYYTGIVFECWDKAGEFRAIFGGGRYDNLLQLFKGVSVPAIGFAIGDVTLELLLKREKIWPFNVGGADVYVIAIYERYFNKTIKIITALRRNDISVMFDYQIRSMDKGLRSASRAKVKYALIIGSEIENDVITLKNMGTQEQIAIKLDDLLLYIKSKNM
ncbi:MAG: histidine--tRNA ligase [Candidatus Thermoplasmatota archaeon]|jgi:histidyl-tRNA synthetase|nr:histidine--tRNA ligase [Candidatus Thermoplasmatota archaeon]MCL5963445.1 histidine--tRNA ligase [Candidatus Thermoplasmatota archaeon]